MVLFPRDLQEPFSFLLDTDSCAALHLCMTQDIPSVSPSFPRGAGVFGLAFHPESHGHSLVQAFEPESLWHSPPLLSPFVCHLHVFGGY
jgi:hypothetical protein